MSLNPRPKILIVDDDEILLFALEETIGAEGYTIIKTTSPHEALGHLQENTFNVVISDQRMAEMDGYIFLERAKEVQPNALRILITGVSEAETIIKAVNQAEIFRFIAKPWTRSQLLETVKEAIRRNQQHQALQKLQEETLRLNEQLAKANQELEVRLQAMPH